MTLETETALAERVYDKTLISGAQRLGAWGPGILTKAEGLWRTPHDVYVLGERVDGDERVSFRIVDETEAADMLHGHGQAWRARQVEKALAAETPDSAAEAEAAADSPEA